MVHYHKCVSGCPIKLINLMHFAVRPTCGSCFLIFLPVLHCDKTRWAFYNFYSEIITDETIPVVWNIAVHFDSPTWLIIIALAWLTNSKVFLLNLMVTHPDPGMQMSGYIWEQLLNALGNPSHKFCSLNAVKTFPMTVIYNCYSKKCCNLIVNLPQSNVVGHSLFSLLLVVEQ